MKKLFYILPMTIIWVVIWLTYGYEKNKIAHQCPNPVEYICPVMETTNEEVNPDDQERYINEKTN